MHIPNKNLGGWAQEIVDECSSSLRERVDRGIAMRSLYLTGDTGGEPQIYNKCFSHIETIASNLFSPAELRFMIDFVGSASPVFKSMGQTASRELNSRIRSGNVDTAVGEAVTWSLVKGKTFIKLLWGDDGFEPYLIQPEMMGVYREDLGNLDRQEAFFQSTYYTPQAFYRFLDTHPDKEEIFSKVKKFQSSEKDSPAKDSENTFKRIILAGMYPFGSTDSASPSGGSRNVVDWMGSPSPSFTPKVFSNLIRMDELWVRDDVREDWTTVQVVADVPVSSKKKYGNLFADALDPDDTMKRRKGYDGNPLCGHHPYLEFCPNALDGYMWGRPELCNVGLIQESINKRVNGIGALLRRQEDPNYLITGTSASVKDIMSKLKKPGGFLVENNPGAKAEKLTPDIPSGLFDTLKEYVQMFEDMSGLTPTMSGRGESGVRAQAHAETLVRTSSPRLKDAAVNVERQVEALGGLALDIMRAKVGTELTTWMMPKATMASKLASIFAKFSEDEFEEAPVPGMKPIKFQMYHLPENCKVMVDSHSASPAFSHDTRELLFALAKLGVITPEQLISRLPLPGSDSLLDDIYRKEIEQQQFAEAHPELAAEAAEKASKKKHK